MGAPGRRLVDGRPADGAGRTRRPRRRVWRTRPRVHSPTLNPMDPNAVRRIDIASSPDDVLETIVIEALEQLPEPFRDRLGSVAIVIEDEPTAAQLASV